MTIDTQGMSTGKGGTVDPNIVYPPFKPKKMTIFNEQESPEPDILIYWENNNQEDDTTLSHYQITRIIQF